MCFSTHSARHMVQASVSGWHSCNARYNRDSCFVRLGAASDQYRPLSVEEQPCRHDISLDSVSLRRRFVEISKRGIWSPQRLAQERPDARYALLAIDFMPISVLRSAMQRLASGLASGAARCLPLCRCLMTAASSALRQLSQACSVQQLTHAYVSMMPRHCSYPVI